MLGDDRQRQRPADIGAALADPFEEAQVLGEAAEGDVLAVVRRRRRLARALGKRLHRPAERRPRLEQRHVGVRVDEVERGGEARETAADHCHLHRIRPRATTASFADVDSRQEAPKTSNSFASMRSRCPR